MAIPYSTVRQTAGGFVKTVIQSEFSEEGLEESMREVLENAERESIERIAGYYREGSHLEGVYADNVRQVSGGQQDGSGTRPDDVLLG